jgi:nucleoid DNA-binding protein
MPNEIPAESIDKRVLWRYVNKKINRVIHHYHVFSVINILFDEIVEDLKQGNQIRIANFGVLELKETKPRKHFDFKKQKIVLSRSYKILRFSLSEKIKKKLTKYLDLDATFKDD